MNRIFSKIRIALIPCILCVVLIVSGFLSVRSIIDLQGDARIINYTGIVRGATQRLIKKELNHVNDDALIQRLDSILQGLIHGSDEFDLIVLDSKEYQALLRDMEKEWKDIKTEIYLFRDGKASGEKLFTLSEGYFELTDHTVFAAEEYTENVVQEAKNLLFYMNLSFVLMAIIYMAIAIYQEKQSKKMQEVENDNRKKSEQLSRRSQELLVPMNEMSELIYVSDMDTYDLLFINDIGKRTFNIHEGDKVKCYKALQGFDAPCSFCNSKSLVKDETFTWEYTNPLTKLHYMLKDRLIEWEGRLARMEIAFDITEEMNEKEDLKIRIERDNILVGCIRELYQNHDVNSAITYALEKTGKLFLADRAYVFDVQDEQISNTEEWCRDDIAPEIDNLQNMFKLDFKTWFDLFNVQENVVIKNTEDLKEKMNSEYEVLTRQGIERIIMVPLERDGKLDGFIGLDNPSLELMESAMSFLEKLRYYIMLAMRRDEDEKALYRLSYLDTLTSFFNRNRFIQDMSELDGKDESVGVIYLDVNGLKEINDQLGHDAGDKLLQNCATLIKKSIQEASFYRIGGDEFVIICKSVEEEALKEMVHLLKNNFSKEACQVAIGYKWAKNCHHIQDSIKDADEIMYADKKEFYHNHKKTGRYRHYNDILDFLSDPMLLQKKLQEKRFEVYLQAKIDIKTKHIVGAEALIRYIDDDGKILSPDKFIPVLESTYQISKIDFYVLETVCAQLQTWKEQGETLFPISSNFSRSTFIEDDFLDKLKAIVDKYDISKELLEIEITEGACYADSQNITDYIHDIREAGFRVSVDDFGAESSNLALLATARFDTLKIDRGFVKDIAHNKYAQMIVKAMVGVCNDMHIHLVAEGVEDNDQLAMLDYCGVNTVQGYLFSKPIPIQEYEWEYLKIRK